MLLAAFLPLRALFEEQGLCTADSRVQLLNIAQ